MDREKFDQYRLRIILIDMYCKYDIFHAPDNYELEWAFRDMVIDQRDIFLRFNIDQRMPEGLHLRINQIVCSARSITSLSAANLDAIVQEQTLNIYTWEAHAFIDCLLDNLAVEHSSRR